MNQIKKHFLSAMILMVALFTVSACGDSDSDSGGNVEPTLPGTDVPVSYVGVYQGTLKITAKAAGLSVSDSYPIKVTVNDNGTIRFDGDEPDETFTVGLANDGSFAGSLNVNEEECTGKVDVTGKVDGKNANGNVNGKGKCRFDGKSLDVTLDGDFSASK